MCDISTKLITAPGGLWEGRYKCNVIESQAYLLSCMRYIELNPVRAGIRLNSAGSAMRPMR